ncbi:hypothetical protein GE21DRAFT_5025 [Neurospora crassa]|uniref:Uncharacterized protein n=1 Tax=Neurospora crassa (strain ATCC 24698 / 74-OR23-1A / CBS 708.71 / DSM 1257 / FGSC 987) TaxID=367110 RepID=U9W5G1_NEUCR|nr:hypothetical protein NCU16702 [Neurospora crassa OR74A]ESA43444.1 hypothetical protein NCU16702 [Neurospora crassa OR74A]KHE86499.1 hypothetical protein GE21DRAFT_5025 [Neurospora crassa]|eukprot:XP_011394066.1 hypothetical protein NCU16702 [Neurospora crassa OR74A]
MVFLAKKARRNQSGSTELHAASTAWATRPALANDKQSSPGDFLVFGLALIAAVRPTTVLGSTANYAANARLQKLIGLGKEGPRGKLGSQLHMTTSVTEKDYLIFWRPLKDSEFGVRPRKMVNHTKKKNKVEAVYRVIVKLVMSMNPLARAEGLVETRTPHHQIQGKTGQRYCQRPTILGT